MRITSQSRQHGIEADAKEFPANKFHDSHDDQKCSRWGCTKSATACRKTGSGHMGACAEHKKEMTKDSSVIQGHARDETQLRAMAYDMREYQQQGWGTTKIRNQLAKKWYATDQEQKAFQEGWSASFRQGRDLEREEERWEGYHPGDPIMGAWYDGWDMVMTYL